MPAVSCYLFNNFVVNLVRFRDNKVLTSAQNMHLPDDTTHRTRAGFEVNRRSVSGKSHSIKTQKQNGQFSSRCCEKCALPLRLKRTYGRTFSTLSPRKASDSHGFEVRGLSAMRLAGLLLLCSLSAVSGRSVSKDECDPNNPFSCKFGATCQLQYGNNRMESGFYRCVCPKIDCFSAGLFDPVCGEDGRTQKPYFNVLCLMLKECEQQRPIRQVCYGSCNSATCKVLTPETTRHTRCPRKHVGFCLNGGLCVHHQIMNRPSCRCPSDYTGERCDVKKPPPPGQIFNEGGEKCESKLGLLAIFAIVLLAIVLVLIVVCLCCRCRKSKDQDEKLWPSSLTERDETTPLRDSARSDYLFPAERPKESEK